MALLNTLTNTSTTPSTRLCALVFMFIFWFVVQFTFGIYLICSARGYSCRHRRGQISNSNKNPNRVQSSSKLPESDENSANSMVSEESDQDARTLFCGNLSENVTEALLYELFLQGGPVERIHIPKKEGKQCSFGFVSYVHLCSIPYAIDLFAGTQLFGRELRINARGANSNRAPQSLQQHNQHNEPPHRHSRSGPNHSEPMGNPFSNSASLRTGLHGSQSQHHDMRPGRGQRNAEHEEKPIMDIHQLVQMGSRLMSGSNQGGRRDDGGYNDNDNYNSGRHSGGGSSSHQYDQNTARPYRRNQSPRSNHQPYDNRSGNDRNYQHRQGGSRQRR